MTTIETNLRYLAAEELLEQILADLKENKARVPQPEGELIADAYKDGRLDSHSTCLHVIACLLRKAK